MQMVLRDSFVDGPLRISWDHGHISLVDFLQICEDNPDLRLERSLQGELYIVPGVGGKRGNRNFEINGQLRDWILRSGKGVGFDSSTQFVLPSGAVYSPDAAWVELTRWNSLTSEQQDRFPPLCPDFVIELMSPSDRLSTAQMKMQEWVANGAQLGWLIDPSTRTVYVYRPGQTILVLQNADSVPGDHPVDGFVLDLSRIWT
jgi:Uma2 family endonuclease